ncbi:UmuC3 [Desulforapulum autotrophicum HRM2]|uniref:UmuC3 n=1 Tax=Desulforapulum autotrophicum (strain ATCC 43914 / DSM 3382 / VKM B-1955 / HRM2) TaxID=177437 RepID=C0QGN3_DESAH|nr:UmuC3 [Desulforapulum autotrophicum HRM2]
MEMTPIGDVWGIGRRLPPFFKYRGIRTALDFKSAAPSLIRGKWASTVSACSGSLQENPATPWRTVLQGENLSPFPDRLKHRQPPLRNCSRPYHSTFPRVRKS